MKSKFSSNSLSKAAQAAAAGSLVAACSLSAALPVTVDFENYMTSGIEATVTSGGFNFTPQSGSLAVLANGQGCDPLCAADGTETLVMGGRGTNPVASGPLRMQAADGQSFRLLGFDFAEFVQGGNLANASRLRVTGHQASGDTLSMLLAIDGINDGPGGANDFQRSSLERDFAAQLFNWVDFSGTRGDSSNYAFQLDNLRVDTSNPVPEPNSIGLVGMGLLAAAFVGRRRRGSA